jgi:hypothetical protein
MKYTIVANVEKEFRIFSYFDKNTKVPVVNFQADVCRHAQ